MINKVLILNGSPRKKLSNTLKLTNAFISSILTNEEYTIEVINLHEKKINYCLGCFNCWVKTPGKCVLKDDMTELLEKFCEANYIIWSFPLYCFSAPAVIKNFQDQMAPLVMPHFYFDGTKIAHYPRREYHIKGMALLCTGGFPEFVGNFEPLEKQFEIMYGNHLTKILCPEGEILSRKEDELQKIANDYLSKVQLAGQMFFKYGGVSEELSNDLHKLMIPQEKFIKEANENWDNLIKEYHKKEK